MEFLNILTMRGKLFHVDSVADADALVINFKCPLRKKGRILIEQKIKGTKILENVRM